MLNHIGPIPLSLMVTVQGMILKKFKKYFRKMYKIKYFYF